MYKHVTKPVFFIVVLIVAVITYLAAFGLHYSYGDTTTDIVKSVQEIRFGIDIRGGVDVTFRPPANYNATRAEMDAAKAKLQTRLDNLNISDRELYVDYGKKRIILRFPWKSTEKNYDPESAIKELGAMAQLVFKSPDYNNGAPIITGNDVKNATAEINPTTGGYMVSLTLKDSGRKAFADATKALYENHGQLAIYMDEKEIETAGVSAVIDNGQAVIEGNFTADSAKKLADQINAGALPFALETDHFSTISPTLGANALKVMVMAGAIAFALVCLFMILYYRLPGVIAFIALTGSVAGTLLAISIPQYTLTLPGIAGVILSIGMGVDCNVITSERIKEELRMGKSLDGAIDSGFERSFSAIFDGNITVIIVGLILMWLGSGAVKSFGYTLIIGVIFNFLMGVTASRLMLKSISKFSFARNLFLYSGRPVQNDKEIISKEKGKAPVDESPTRLNIDFVGKRRIYYAISITLIAAGILVSAIFGVKLDIQFKGGAIIKYSYTGTIAPTDAQHVAEKTFPGAHVSTKIDNIAATKTNLLVFELDKSISENDQQSLYTALTSAYKDNNIQKYESNDVSPQMGREFLRTSVGAVLLASALIIIYIWFRFRHIGGLPAGVTAFISLLHDVLMAFATFSVLRIPLNDNFIAVALTILGYSINDTIVIYDRIRENRRLYGTKLPFGEIVNKSINQSFTRSVNTVLATFFSLAVVCVFAIIYNLESIRSFAFPMMVGVISGCYSTICIAGPLWTTWTEYKERKHPPKGQRLAPKRA